MNELELKREKIEKLVKVGAVGVVGFLVAPFVFVAIKGLVGLLIAGVIGLTAINLAPWFAAKVANWRIKALKHEASKNPIETLQNNYMSRQQALAKFKDSITKFTAEVATFADKLVGFNKQYPDEAEKFKMQLNKMRQLLKVRENKYREADQNLKEYNMEIKKASAIWDMGQAAAAMNKAAGMSEEDFLAKIQVETALDSVQKNLNTAFAELETSLLDEEIDKPKEKLDPEFVNLLQKEVSLTK